MKRILLAAFGLAAALSSTRAYATCYHFESSPSDVYVCVAKGRDDFADRKKGQEICSQKTGSKCGPVGSTSSSCHSNSGKCYDGDGNAHSDLSGY